MLWVNGQRKIIEWFAHCGGCCCCRCSCCWGFRSLLCASLLLILVFFVRPVFAQLLCCSCFCCQGNAHEIFIKMHTNTRRWDTHTTTHTTHKNTHVLYKKRDLDFFAYVCVFCPIFQRKFCCFSLLLRFVRLFFFFFSFTRFALTGEISVNLCDHTHTHGQKKGEEERERDTVTLTRTHRLFCRKIRGKSNYDQRALSSPTFS